VLGRCRPCTCALVFTALKTPEQLAVQRIASDPKLDVDGQPLRWRWAMTATAGASLDRWHEIDRDGLGRIVKIRDVTGGVMKNELEYNYSSASGAVMEDSRFIKDNGPALGVLYSGNVPGASLTNLGYHPTRDVLTSWNDDDGAHNLSLSAIGLRTTEDGGAYNYTSEKLNTRNYAGSDARDVRVFYTTGGYASSVDYAYDTPDLVVEISSMTRGPRGDYVAYTTQLGVLSQKRDHTMHRWFLDGGNSRAEFGWGPNGQLVDRHQVNATQLGNFYNRDEYVYLFGMPIAAVHTDSFNPAPVSWHLSGDAMGTPRRALHRTDAAMSQVSRLIMNPWGKGTQIDTFGFASYPQLIFRLPGQVADPSGLVENQHRTYLPHLGIYLQPDPMHQQSVQSGIGPQAYAYANGNPGRYSDSSGLTPWTQRYDTMVDAARAALEEYNPLSRALRGEFSGFIFRKEGQQGYFYSEMVQHLLPSARAKGSPGLASLKEIFRSNLASLDCEFDIAAGCHTHGRANPDYYDEFFSGTGPCSGPGCLPSPSTEQGDLDDARNNGIPEFLGTPSNRFLGFFPIRGTTVEYPRLR
jgi:RHS repeat-associated protein